MNIKNKNNRRVIGFLCAYIFVNSAFAITITNINSISGDGGPYYYVEIMEAKNCIGILGLEPIMGVDLWWDQIFKTDIPIGVNNEYEFLCVNVTFVKNGLINRFYNHLVKNVDACHLEIFFSEASESSGNNPDLWKRHEGFAKATPECEFTGPCSWSGRNEDPPKPPMYTDLPSTDNYIDYKNDVVNSSEQANKDYTDCRAHPTPPCTTCLS